MRGVSLALCLSLVFGVTSVSSAQQPPASKNPVVVLETSLGTIKIELYPDKAPETVKNFLNYVDKKFYDGTVFHRVISNFMIQGGGMTPGMVEKQTDAPIKNEAKNAISNLKGTIAMARTGDPHSATSQFFINVVDNRFLDQANSRDRWGYCAFGKVIEGMDVVEKIKNVPTKSLSEQVRDVPVNDVVIKTVRRAN